MIDVPDLSRFPLRPTCALIDLDAIEQNVRAVIRTLTKNTRLIGVVKGNGYGHGATMVGETAIRAGASGLAVATVGEGRRLREEGIETSILVLGPTHRREHELAVGLGLELAVGDPATIASIAAAAKLLDRTARVHLKIDTGMHRYGADPVDAVAMAKLISDTPGLGFAGIFTHFASADEPDETDTLAQAECFDDTVEVIRSSGIAVPLLHVANTAATLRSRRYDYGAVRLGIGMYGLSPSSAIAPVAGMRPALRLESTISRIATLQAGDRVSYGGTYEALQTERIALVPCGYADGYRRALSNRGWVALGKQMLPIRGRVCMDQLVVGLPGEIDAAIGDRVVIIADEQGRGPSAVDLAEMLDTIPYEIIAAVSARVPRVYLRGGEVIAIEDLIGLSRFG